MELSTLGRETGPTLGEDLTRQPATAANVSRTQIENWLITRIAALSSKDLGAIAVDRPFADFALDSALIISVTQELSRWLGKDLSVTLFWEHPTIEDLAKSLAAE